MVCLEKETDLIVFVTIQVGRSARIESNDPLEPDCNRTYQKVAPFDDALTSVEGYDYKRYNDKHYHFIPLDSLDELMDKTLKLGVSYHLVREIAGCLAYPICKILGINEKIARMSEAMETCSLEDSSDE